MARPSLIIALFALFFASCTSSLFGDGSIEGSSGRSSKVPAVEATPVPTPTVAPTPEPTPSYKVTSIGGFLHRKEGWSVDEVSDLASLYSIADFEFGGFIDGLQGIEVDLASDTLYALANYEIARYRLSDGAYMGSIGRSAGSSGDCPNSASAEAWCEGATHETSRARGGLTDDAYSFDIDKVNRKLYFADSDHDRIQRFDLDTGAFEDSVGRAPGGYLTSTNKMTAPIAFTISAWYKNGSANGGYIIGFHSAQTGSPNSEGRHLYMHTDGKVSFGVDAGGHQIITTAGSYNDGNWHHFVGTYFPDRMVLYVDGVEEGSLTGFPAIQSYSGYWRMGYNPGGWAGLPGAKYEPEQLIDNVAIWRTELDATEVATVHANPEPSDSYPKFDQTIAGWRFEETSGRTFADISPFDNPARFRGTINYGTAGKTGSTVSFNDAVVGNGWTDQFDTISGNVDGAMYYPLSVNVHDGKMYISESGHDYIHRWDVATGLQDGAIGNLSSSTGTCPATGAAPGWCTGGVFSANGHGDGRYDDPYMMEFDSANDVMYLADYDASRVVKIQLSTGAFIGAIGKTSSSTGTCPATGVATGWCTGGHFTSGSGDGEFDKVRGLAIDNENQILYVADRKNARVQRIDLASGTATGSIGYTSSSTGTCPNGGPTTGWCMGGTFTPTYASGGFRDPVDLELAGGKLYVSNNDTSTIFRFDAATGAFEGRINQPIITRVNTWTEVNKDFSTDEIEGDGAFDDPEGLAIDNENDILYIADADSDRVVKHRLSTGEFLGMIGGVDTSTGTCPAGAATTGWCTGGIGAEGTGDGYLESPRGVAIDTENKWLYVSDRHNNRISKYQLDTGSYIGSIGLLTGTSGACPASGAAPGWCKGGTFGAGGGDGELDTPHAIALDVAGDRLYIADVENFRIVQIQASTGAFVSAMGLVSVAGGSCATGVSGWCSGGTFSETHLDGGFDRPVNLAIDTSSRRLYVSDLGNGRISKFNLDTGLHIASMGNLAYNYDPAGSCQNVLGPTGWCTGGVFNSFTSNDPTVLTNYAPGGGIVLVPESDLFYFANTEGDTINKYRLSTGEFLGAMGHVRRAGGTCTSEGPSLNFCKGGTFTKAASISGSFTRPTFLVRDSAGNIYVSEDDPSRVTRIVPPENQ